jgi:hypothetical protein
MLRRKLRFGGQVPALDDSLPAQASLKGASVDHCV